MKTISLWQPWASLVVIGAKVHETRHWSTSYRGPMLIHAAKRFGNDERQTCLNPPFKDALKGTYATLGDVPRGCIVGIVDLVEIFKTSGDCIWQGGNWATVPEPECRFGDFGFGRFAWKLSNPRRFETPIPYRGLQQLFNVPDDLVAEQMAKAVTA
jgi:hypothetical protein